MRPVRLVLPLLAAACATGHGGAAEGLVEITFQPVEHEPAAELHLEEARLIVASFELEAGTDEAAPAGDHGHGHAHLHSAIRQLTDGHVPGATIDLLAGHAAAPIEAMAGHWQGLQLTLAADDRGCALHLVGTIDLEAEEVPVRICLPAPAVPIAIALPFDLEHQGHVDLSLHLELDRLLGQLPLASLARDDQGAVVIDVVENSGAFALLAQGFATAFEGHVGSHGDHEDHDHHEH